MSPKFLTDEELITALKAAFKAQFKDSRVVSWTSNGTSVSKQLMSRRELDSMATALTREAHYRIGEGNAAVQAAFPRIAGWKRPQGERLSAFTS